VLVHFSNQYRLLAKVSPLSGFSAQVPVVFKTLVALLLLLSTPFLAKVAPARPQHEAGHPPLCMQTRHGNQVVA
jgi:hypothetical protein